MAPQACKICGRPMTKCVCPVDSDDDDESEDFSINDHGDDDWGTPDIPVM